MSEATTRNIAQLPTIEAELVMSYFKETALVKQRVLLKVAYAVPPICGEQDRYGYQKRKKPL